MESIVIDAKYLKEFPYLSLEELKQCKALSSSDEAFAFKAACKNSDRKMKKLYGVRAIQSYPLVHVLSLKVQSEDESIAIYGTVSAGYQRLDCKIKHELFKQKRGDAQLVGTGGDLALKGNFAYELDHDHACLPLQKSSIDVELELYDATGNDFAKKSFQLDVEIEDNGYEVVKSESIPCGQGAGNLTLQYIVIPFGVSCCLDILVRYRRPTEEDYSFDVSGRIVVKYANTYGSYSSEECVLFDKQGKEFETVHSGEGLQLSRCWVAVPAYASLLVDIDLSEFGSDQKIVKDTIMLHPLGDMPSADSIVLDDYIITVDAAWVSPDYNWPHHPYEAIPTQLEEMHTEGKDDESFDDGLSYNTSSWRHQLPPFHALEIFSVFIGQEKSTAQVYGSVEVLSGYEIVRSIFKRDEKNAFTLSQHKRFIPVLDVSRVLRNFSPLVMKLDIKDVECSLAKGDGDWGPHILGNDLCYDRQLCSLVRGEHGFAAVHYSIFSKAVVANIKIIPEFKTVSVDTNPRVCGSLMAQYSRFDYSSKHHKDCYRSLLFRRDEDDPVQLGVDCSIPLSRSVIVVPSYSSLVLDLDLSFGAVAEKLSRVEEIEHFQSKTVETHDCALHIEIDWQQIQAK